ncbi:acyltransferase domain protein [Mycobacterium kansasii]|uniref:Acyltransferase domain protein n=1 Tax=Mycobacterium kansasii TaxID=1768 RepID=A0A1V3X9K6_MYCKA|nr:acyltransferase domain protein [Mycobacterium kansasii]
MAEPTYRTLEILAKLLVLATGTRITYLGVENVPARAAPWSLSTTPAMSTGCRPHWP